MRSLFDVNPRDDDSEVFADSSVRYATEIYSPRKREIVDNEGNGTNFTAESPTTVEVFLVQPTKNGDNGDGIQEQQKRIKTNWWASNVARNPWLHFWAALITALGFSAGGLATGDLVVDPELVGWFSRGTDIAKKQNQVFIVQSNTGGKLSYDAGWDELTNYVQPSWETTGEDFTRRLEETAVDPTQCDLDWYTSGDFMNRRTLWPVWRTTGQTSALDPEVIQHICLAEEVTQNFLESEGLCGGCPTGCLPPLSLVSFARIHVQDFLLQLSCEELATAWANVRSRLETNLMDCAGALRSNFTLGGDLPSECPLGFAPHMVDAAFGVDGSPMIRTTSTVFATAYNGASTRELYSLQAAFGRAEESDLVQGAYDTQFENFNEFAFGRAIWADTILAVVAGAVTTLAMIVHTKSLWLSVVGLIQILVSFPLAFFFYRVVLGIVYFPFLNFLGIYVVLALGADDVFVAVDKWKNARLQHPNASREEIASLALPDAAVAMCLTTITTAAAFWATAICPVTTLRVFAIFLGLIVIFDYVLCVVLVFPAICLFDRWKVGGKAGWYVELGSKKPPQVPSTVTTYPEIRNEIVVDDEASDADHDSKEGHEWKGSFIMRVLSQYYEVLHRLRYILLVLFAAAFGVSIYYALQLELPSTSAVRQLPSNHETELNFSWREQLLDRTLLEQIGRQVQVLWGVTPADTGDHLDPDEGSQLVLDDSFDPSLPENQVYLKNFCRKLLDQDFASAITDSFQCPLDVFEEWLSSRGNSTDGSFGCPLSAAFPVEPDLFHVCVDEFLLSDLAEENSVSNRLYQRNGKVEIIRLPFRQIGIRFDSGYNVLDEAWNLFDGFMESQNDIAPEGVNSAFGSSFDFWWYETNGKMFFTAYAGTGIALAAIFVILLFSSRSIKITLLAVLTITDVLTTVSMFLTLSGWTLGFLEAICFAILVGMSVDFVLHFSHAYGKLPGIVDRHTRTKYALTSMGPSIIAAAFTTISAAIVMMFARISFFRRFAVILLYTISTGLVASMVLFIVLADTLGPSEPTKLIDGIFGACGNATMRDETTTKSSTKATTIRTELSQTKTGISGSPKPALFQSERVTDPAPYAPSAHDTESTSPSLQHLALEEIA